MIKAIIFDYFGVISSDGWEMRDQLSGGLKREFGEIAKEVNSGNISWEEFLSRLSEESGASPEQINQMYSQHNLDLKLLHFAANLHEKYKIALLSNASSEYLLPIVKSAGLDSLFDEIVVSSDVGVVKPDPRIYQIAVERLGLAPEEVIMIDDQIKNVNGAVHAGLAGVQFKNLEQLKADLSTIGVLL